MSSDRSRLGLAAIAALAIAGGSCNVRSRVVHPTFANGGLLRDATPLTAGALAQLEGVFDVDAVDEVFGRDVASRASPGRISFFGPKEAVFAILEGGCLQGGEQLVLEGYWRYATTTDTGLVRLFVGPTEATRALCAGEKIPEGAGPLVISGAVGREYDLPQMDLAFRWKRALTATNDQFVVVAHHGTQTIEDYGASENTVEGFRVAEAMGADGIELDVRITKDSVPIMFHDASFNERLVDGRFCHGYVSDLTFAQIRASCRNKYGEKIYSLEEGLRGIIDETTVRDIWIDVKETEAVAPTVKVMAAADTYAASKGRSIIDVIGLSSEDLTDAFFATPEAATTRCLIEYDPDVALSKGCVTWGPRFTEGPRAKDVQAAQEAGLAVVFWTVDGPAFMEQILREAKPNGMITDMPGFAFYVYQTQPWTLKGGKPGGKRGEKGQ